MLIFSVFRKRFGVAILFVGLLSSQNICAQVFEVADSGKMNDGLASVSGLATRWE